MGFSREEHWNGLLFPTPGNLPDPGIEPRSLKSPALAGRFFITSATWEAQFSSVQLLNHVQLFATPWIASFQASLSTPTPGVHSNSRPLSRWCHPAISSSVVPFSCCLQSFPALRSFPISQFFTWDGQSIGISASTSILPMNTQDWSPLGWTGWIFLKFKGFSRVFCYRALIWVPCDITANSHWLSMLHMVM